MRSPAIYWISSLPPTSGQSFLYEGDQEAMTFVPTEQLGPTAFRSPLTIGKHVLSLRAAGSYFPEKSPVHALGKAAEDRSGRKTRTRELSRPRPSTLESVVSPPYKRAMPVVALPLCSSFSESS